MRTNDQAIVIRWFLRDHPEFIPEVEVETDEETGQQINRFSDDAWEGFKAWTDRTLASMSLTKLRQLQKYLNDPNEVI